MKNKIILGLSLMVPLTAKGLELHGSQTYSDEINIPTTHEASINPSGLSGSGIIIDGSGESNTTFEKNVNILLDSDHLEGIKLSTISQHQNSKTVFNKDLTINMKGDEVHGIIFEDNIASEGQNIIEVNGKTTINIESDKKGSYAINNRISNSKINLNGGAFINGDISTVGLTNIYGDTVLNGDMHVSSTGSLNITGKALITGDFYSHDGRTNKSTFNLKSGSKFIGSTGPYQGSPNDWVRGSGINIVLDKDASWEITTKTASLDSLRGNGNIKFTNDDYGTLYIYNLGFIPSWEEQNISMLDNSKINEGLNFDIRINVEERKNDKLDMYDVKGLHTLNIANNGSAHTNGTERFLVAQSHNTEQLVDSETGLEIDVPSSIPSEGDFKLNHTVELGGYEYTLTRDYDLTKDYELIRDFNSWYLDAGYHTDPKPPEPPITTSANASAGFLNANYLMTHIETQTLLQRMGDMRNNGEYGDVWLRGFSGNLDSFSGGKISRFDMHYNGFQFGADKQLSEDSPFVIGGFIGQTHGTPNYRKGDGSLRSFNTGLYMTYLHDNGFYIDSVTKYARINNRFKVRDTENKRVQGSGHTNGLNLSIELGKKFKVNDFYIEPQTQWTFAHQNGTSINATNGLKVKLGEYDSLIGRASTLFGYEINSENNKINVYAKTGILREFKADTYYKLNGNREDHPFKGNWWNNGIGISAQLYQKHTIYFDLENSKGNRFDLFQVNGGYRYSF